MDHRRLPFLVGKCDTIRIGEFRNTSSQEEILRERQLRGPELDAREQRQTMVYTFVLFCPSTCWHSPLPSRLERGPGTSLSNLEATYTRKSALTCVTTAVADVERVRTACENSGGSGSTSAYFKRREKVFVGQKTWSDTNPPRCRVRPDNERGFWLERLSDARRLVKPKQLRQQNMPVTSPLDPSRTSVIVGCSIVARRFQQRRIVGSTRQRRREIKSRRPRR